MANYSYWINFVKDTPSWSEFWPNKESEATKKQPTMQEFFREDVDEIKINRQRGDKDNSTVYDLLESWFTDKTKFNDEIEIEIYRGTRSGTLYYAGFFSISDTTLDNEKKTFKVTPRIDDEYRSILEVKDAKFDARGQVLGEDVILGIPQVIGAWVAASPGATYLDFDTFTVGGDNGILTSVIGTDGVNAQAQHIALGALTSSDVIFIDITAYNLTGAQDPFFDIVDAADASITVGGPQQVAGTGILSFRLNATGNAFLLLSEDAADTTNFTMTFFLDISDQVKNNIGALIMDFVERYMTVSNLMGLSGFIGNIKSTFFANDALPSDAPSTIDTYITANPNGNYVTEDADNPLNELIISETRHWVTDDVTEIKVSFIELMDAINQTFDTGWYIDADGDFRIEHRKYFELLWDDSTAIDLTGAGFSKYKPNIDDNELNHNKALLANREQFTWQQVGTIGDSEDFVGVDITYDNLETVENTLQHEARMITTDIIYLNDNPDDTSAEGFIFFQCYIDGGDFVIQKEVGVLSTDNIRNNHMSWANLHDKYWTWRRMSENGDMNDGDTTAFDTAVKFLEQSNVKFGIQTTVDGFIKITTSQGDGRQLETKRNLDSDFLTIKLGYNPYE